MHKLDNSIVNLRLCNFFALLQLWYCCHEMRMYCVISFHPLHISSTFKFLCSVNIFFCDEIAIIFRNYYVVFPFLLNNVRSRKMRIMCYSIAVSYEVRITLFRNTDLLCVLKYVSQIESLKLFNNNTLIIFYNL